MFLARIKIDTKLIKSHLSILKFKHEEKIITVSSKR